MNHKRAFTLVEILVVVAVMVMLAALTLPGIKAMQSASARSEALNTINAALQGVRSYAIMNNCKAAARFQPNGKIAFVYRFTNDQGKAKYKALNDGAGVGNNYPRIGNPNSAGYIYLPVLDQEPLKLPNGYAAGKLTTVPGENGLDPNFYEPFYICYNADGTLAANEPIWVALIDDVTVANPEPVNVNFDGVNGFAWNAPVLSYNLDTWLEFTQNTVAGKTDAKETNDVNDRKLVRYYYFAENASDLNTIFESGDVGIDHYAGRTCNGTSNQYPPTIRGNDDNTSVSQFAIFKTPDNWTSMPLFDTNVSDTKSTYVQTNLYSDSDPINPDLYEMIFLNPYTGRMIRPME
jgi:prepilin-type N-terminal cleavage/methylation domain-containing protein